MTLRSVLTADLTDVFHNADDFNTGAVYNGTEIVYGYFDNEYLSVLLEGDVAAESVQPMFRLPLSSVPNVAHGDTFLIDSVTYTVHNVQPDGLGSVLVLLDK